MAKVTLTDAAVQRYKAAPGERKNYFDKTLPGIGFAHLRPAEGEAGRSAADERRQQELGALLPLRRQIEDAGAFQPGYPALGLKEARQQARDALQAVGRQEDPAALKAAAAQRARDQAKDTVEAVTDEFIRRALNGRRSPHYIRETLTPTSTCT